MENIRKFFSVFRSPALTAIARWSKCVHGRILLICALNMTATLCSLGLTLATRGLIDGAVSSRSDALWRYGIILAALLLSSRGLSASVSLLRTHTSARLQRSLQGMLTRELLSKDYTGLKGYHSGELVNRVFSDMNVVKNGVMNILPSLIGITVSFFGASAILLSMDWRFVILLIGGGLLGLAIMIAFRTPIKTRHRRMQEAEGALHAATQETLENIRLIKASVSEERASGQIGERQDGLEHEQVRQGRFSSLMNQSMGLVFDLSWLCCMLWGCTNIFRGLMTYGALAAMIQLIGRIQGPIANAVSLASQVYSVTASAERLLELTDLPAEDRGEIITDFDDICLQDVTFRYDDGTEDVLQDISVTIRRGDFIALTGISGGGKTSLFQLLLGIYRPTDGQVVFHADGRAYPAGRGTRGLFAYVPQGNTLFSGTLRDNLTMFTDDASDEEIARAVHAACIDELVAEIGLDAVLGERGVGLSEGQAQRVAVARALIGGAPILLLDESTSALDEETEARMLKNISAMRDKTCLIVTHRRAALAICSRTLHMENGRILASAEDPFH